MLARDLRALAAESRSRRAVGQGELPTSHSYRIRNGMAATRIRKTFSYPAEDSDEDDAPRGMDEEGA